MMAAQLAEQNDEPEPEPEIEEQKFEQPEIEVPEEVLATVQVTQIAIVDADKVKNEVMDMDAQKEDNTARGVVTQEGSDDADKFKAVQEQVIVKEPEPEVKPKEEEIFVAVEQQRKYKKIRERQKIAPLYKDCMKLLILQTEHNREVKVASNGNTIVFTRLPSGHLLHNADCFAVEIGCE